MALKETIVVNVNDVAAKYEIRTLEDQIKQLGALASKAINPRFDSEGKLTGYLTTIEDKYGRILKINTEVVAKLNEQGEVIGQEDKIVSSSLVINYEKMARLAEQRSKATKEEMQAAKEQAEAEKRRIEHLQDLMRLRIQEAENKKKEEAADAEAERIAKRLLAEEEELARKTEERAQKEKEISAEKARQAEHAQRQQGLNLTFANWNDWGADSGYQSRLSQSFVAATIPIQQYIDNLTGVNRAQSRINETTSMFATISDKTYSEYAQRNGLVQEATKKTGKEVEDVGNKAQKTSTKISFLNTVFLRVAHTMLSSVVRSFREAITEMKNVDTQLTVISRVTQTNIADLENLKNKAYEVGSAYGVMASDYLSAAAAFSRAGYREQAEDLAELSSKLQIAGGVSADVANQFLIATDKAYQLNGSVTKLSDVMDKLTVIDHNYATSVEKIADGMGIVAPVAAQAHMSTEELIASLGTITAVTQRSGTEAARALRALILSIIKDTTTEIDEGVTWTIEEINSLQDALKLYAPEVVKAAEATGSLIDPMEAIAALAKSYEDGLLTEAKLAQLTSSLGGKLRASQLLSLIQNYSGMYTDMLNQMETATGAVDKDIEKSLESWEVKIKQLKNTFTEFVEKSLSSDFFKGMLDAVKWLIEGFGSLGTVVGIFGTALLALKVPTIISWFSSLIKMIKGVGGGFMNAITTLFNYKTMSKLVEGENYALATSYAAAEAAASAFTLIVAALAIAISASVIAINKYKQKLDETIERGKKAYDELKSLDDLQDKYNSLQQQYKDGTISEEEYAKGKDEVIKKLDEEGVWVDAVTGKYETLEEKIQAAIDKSKEYKLIEINDAIEALNEKAFFGILDNSLSRGNDTFQVAQSLGIAPSKVTGSSSYSYKYEYDLDKLVEIYDAAVARREELFKNGQYGSYEDKQLQAWIESAEEVVSAYKVLKEKRDEYLGVDSGEDTVKLVTDETTKSIKGLSDELETATKALDKYKKALEGGEKGDALKSYSDAYKKAIEMYEKGLTGSNQYMSAVDLLFGEVDDYEEAGKLLGNAFVKAMFEGGGDDYGANAANYIRKHQKDFEEHGVQITEGENGTFGLMVTDMDKFAEYTNLSADALWTLIDALDIFDSKTTYTRDQLFNFMGLEDDGAEKFVNLTALINDLAGQGKSAREIKDIVDAIKELAETDGNIQITEPEDLDQTIKDIVELNKEAEKDKDMEVVLTSNSEEFFDGIRKEIDQINGTTIYIGIRTKNSRFGLNDGLGSEASGTRSARGGLSLVNEEGAELIYANGKAWIAGGGDPTITNLPAGAGVFTAKETREILTRSGIESHDGDGAYVGGIPDFTSGGSGKAGKGKLTESLLKQIADYINDILKKAKEALQEQLDAIDEQIDKLKREHDAEEDANKLEELRLKILEAEKKLAEAEQERTVRYFNKETGQWEWMADQKAVADAQKALQDARDAYDKEVAEQAYQAQIQALQDQKEALNKAYDELEGNWEKILEELEKNVNGNKTVNIEALLKKLLGTKGGSYVPDIKAILEAIAAFTANPTSVLDEATTAQILSGQGATGGGASSVLSALVGSGTYDLNGKSQSVFGGNTSIVGDTIYYINGVHIGSDMVDKPLSQILSVLPIYAN